MNAEEKRIRQALGAVNALIVGAETRAMRKYWERVEAYWLNKLKTLKSGE